MEKKGEVFGDDTYLLVVCSMWWCIHWISTRLNGLGGDIIRDNTSKRLTAAVVSFHPVVG